MKRKSFKTATNAPAQPPRKRPTLPPPTPPPPPPLPLKKVTLGKKHSARRGLSSRKKVLPSQPQPQPAPSHTSQIEAVPPPSSQTRPPSSPPPPPPQAKAEPAQLDPPVQETQLDPPVQET